MQPQISPAYRLLHAGWNYNGFVMDIFGIADKDGAEVCALAPAGTRIDLEVVAFSGVYEEAQDFMDKQAPIMLREHRFDASIELAQWQRAA